MADHTQPRCIGQSGPSSTSCLIFPTVFATRGRCPFAISRTFGPEGPHQRVVAVPSPSVKRTRFLELWGRGFWRRWRWGGRAKDCS